jgi:predicted ATPase
VLAARIAIESGPVVVDAAGEIFGDVPNIAARAQALAEPGSVVVTARVQRQIAGLFVAEERGSHQLKGVPELVTLFRIVRASGGGRHAGQRHLTPLVGRDEEIAMLMRRWERARQGDGQLVLIVGEPGLGKSRLVEEFHNRLRDTPHTWIEWSCSQLLQNTPLHPIADSVRARFGGSDLSAEQRLAELENSLSQVKLDPVENAPLLAPLLDIPLPSERALALAPEELRRRQLAALTAWLLAGAQAQALLLAVEDAHWADPTTLDLLRGIAERGALAPLFVLITARPEFRPPWGMRSHHSLIALAPLDRNQVRHMVGALAARHALPKEVVESVTERTGGVPLFVEEVTRLMLEQGAQGGVKAIPPTLKQSLTARLDRLGPAREVAQIGAVIGRDFSYRLIRAVAGIEDTPLQTALERLAEADILLAQGLPPVSD